MKDKEQKSGLTPLFIASYDLGTPFLTQPLTGGLVHDINRITTEKGEFVYKAYKNGDQQGLEEELRLISFLQDKGFPVPTVMETRYGRNIARYQNGIGYLYSYIDGQTPTAPNELSSEQARTAGELLGRYHQLTGEFQATAKNPSGFPLYNPDRFFPRDDVASLWMRVLEELSARKNKTETDEEIQRVGVEKLKRLADLNESSINGLVEALPRVRGHGDYQGTNLIFGEGGISGVIDWEFNRELARAWELQYAITLTCKVDNTENFNTPLDLEKVRTFIEAYKRTAPLPLAEAELSAMPIMAHAVSFNPIFLLKARYIDKKSNLDVFIPKEYDHWFWWDNNVDIYREVINS